MDFPENLGVIIETPGFLGNMTGKKNLQILASLNRKVMDGEIEAVLRRVGLDPGLKKSVQKYSLGMRQRLGIAQAIMEDPDLLILDEPFNGLDKRGVQEIRTLLKELKQREKPSFWPVTTDRILMNCVIRSARWMLGFYKWSGQNM